VCTAFRAILHAHLLKDYHSSCQDYPPDPSITKHFFSIFYEAMVHEVWVTSPSAGKLVDADGGFATVSLFGVEVFPFR
jgi:hypothetical protein